MADQNTNRKKRSDEIIEEYIYEFGEAPFVPWTCYSYDDPQYIAMLEKAIKLGRPITDEDIHEFFPMDDGNIY